MIPYPEVPTPTKVQSLQRTLYRKAKESPRWRAWTLYRELCRRDVLATALKAVLRNAGAAGEDRVTTEWVKANSAAFLDGLEAELKNRSYRPGLVLRVWIEKDDGKQRPLGIPTVYSNCTRDQRVFGLGRYHPSVPSAARPEIPDLEIKDVLGPAHADFGGRGMRHVFGFAGVD